MKKYSKLAVALVVGCCVLHVGQALADTITQTYGDGAYNFPSVNGVPGMSSYPDSIGNNPDVRGIQITFDSATGRLESITIDSATAFDPTTAGFASLYINTTSIGENWDYLVHTGGDNKVYYANDPSKVPTVDGLYQVTDQNNIKYTTVVADPGDGTSGRTDHPNSISLDSLTPTPIATVGVIYASGVTDAFFTSGGGYTITYDFNALDIIIPSLSISSGIYLDPQFTIGWTPYCANDVVYTGSKWDGPTGSVPEPATMILFGTGITALAAWRMRRSNIGDGK